MQMQAELAEILAWYGFEGIYAVLARNEEGKTPSR
ncbi:hypothetical protein PSAC2689_50130 [Paraburkholderia sacchari]